MSLWDAIQPRFEQHKINKEKYAGALQNGHQMMKIMIKRLVLVTGRVGLQGRGLRSRMRYVRWCFVMRGGLTGKSD